jgi:thioredoxin 1
MKKVYKFFATWCGPCKMLSKTLSTVESPLEIEEIDVDQNKDLAKEFKIRGVPTLIIVEDDKELKRKTGVMSAEDYLQWVNS